MTDTAQIEGLLARVEAATGPDRELDKAIHAATGVAPMRAPYVAAQEPVTASIDMALRLIDRELPGWHYTADSSAIEVQLFSPTWPHGPSSDGHGATMPLAYLAALLKALASNEAPK